VVLAGLLVVCCALLAAAHSLRAAMGSCVAYSRVLPPALRAIVRTREYSPPRFAQSCVLASAQARDGKEKVPVAAAFKVPSLRWDGLRLTW
jgi:hypothetical protein